MNNNQFLIGGLRGWHGVLFGLLASVAFLFGGRLRLRGLRFSIGDGFCFSLALLFAGGVVWLGVTAGILGAALLGSTFFGVEIWLILRWLATTERSRDALILFLGILLIVFFLAIFGNALFGR